MSSSLQAPEEAAPVRAPAALRMIGALVRTSLALGPSLLPSRWRRALPEALRDGPLAAATIATGVIEMGVALFGGAIAFERFRQVWTAELMQAMGRAIMEAPEHQIDNGVLMGVGLAAYLRFFFTPAGMAAFFFFVEGVLRALSGGILGEPAGLFPLFALAEGSEAVRARIRRRRERERLVVDQLLEGEDGALTIATCRARDWDELTTIGWDERLFRVEEHRVLEADRVRPHRYRLAPWPEGRVVRRLHWFSPDELLRE